MTAQPARCKGWRRALAPGPLAARPPPRFNGAVSSLFTLYEPVRQTVPVLLTSAHSGQAYPEDFLAAARLDAPTLRRSEDSFVDELFAAAPALGMPLLCANFPRAFCDVNREAWELDPEMFTEPLPPWVNSDSQRVQSGLGMMARVVTSGAPIYRRKLPFAEAERRVRDYWQPWHDALARLVMATRRRFGACLLVDCHSMPRAELAPGTSDFILGDLHGTSCHRLITGAVERLIEGEGYSVRRNLPYAGGFITRHYGMPSRNEHALQIEIARDLYMDEAALRKDAGFAPLQAAMAQVLARVAEEAGSWLGKAQADRP